MDTLSAKFASCLVNLVNNPRKYDVEVGFHVGSLVYDSRNKLAERAINSNADYVLWLDSDMTFMPDTLHMMLLTLINNQLPILAGIYYRRRPPFMPTIFKEVTISHLGVRCDNYPEDEIPEIDNEELMTGLTKCKNELNELLKTYDAGKVMREGVDTVIAGRPNVGKSTLMNLLSGCERSIVTNIPGTTRDIIEETVMLGDVPLRLSDTAGIHSTDDPVESIGVQRAKDRLLSAGLIFAVFDASMPLSEDDLELLELLKNAPAVAVINKSDLESKTDIDFIRSKVSHSVLISAKTGEGADALATEVGEIVGTSGLDASQGILATERQYSDAASALRSVEEAIDALNMGITYDAVTVVIEDAINSLLELTGERVTEAVVDKVFSHFCVGK